MSAYYTNLFTVETYEAFLHSSRTVSGFRESQETMAKRVKPGDKLIGYIKGLSRWCAVFEVVAGPKIDRTPLFHPKDDPYVVRFTVRAAPALEFEHAVPIREREVFDRLTFTKGREDAYWLGPLRRSLQHLEPADGKYLEDLLRRQQTAKKVHPLDVDQLDSLRPKQIKRADGVASVVVPPDAEEAEQPAKVDRESAKVQAKLARLGEIMGFRVWIPKSDRISVLRNWQPRDGALLESLPLNYDDVTLQTIERIDVIWLKGRAIQRAFEVEHTTAVYSGLLRMADLLALQPNMNIALHIVAPEERQKKVLDEIRRPVFSLLEHHPLAKRCSFIGYESLDEIMALPHLGHTSDTVIEEYEERAE
jgi:predicted RNA-binding protein